MISKTNKYMYLKITVDFYRIHIFLFINNPKGYFYIQLMIIITFSNNK